MNWNQRLTQARTAKGITKAEMARRVGVSPATATMWENGTTNALAGKNLDAVCELLGVTTQWLLYGVETGRDTLLEPFPSAMRVAYQDPDDPGFVAIRMVRLQLSAGIMGFGIEPDHDADTVRKMSQRWVEKNGFNLDNLIAIKVRGESMEPSLYDGDVVIINTADTTPVDGAVFAVNYEGEAVVKRMVRNAGSWWLGSDNPDKRRFDNKICRGNDCMIVGRVVWREGSRI